MSVSIVANASEAGGELLFGEEEAAIVAAPSDVADETALLP